MSLPKDRTHGRHTPAMAMSHRCRTPVISGPGRPLRFDSDAVARGLMQRDRMPGELARSTHRLIRLLRPENVGTAAQTAMTWLKPLPISPGKPIPNIPRFPATLGRLG